MDRQSKTKDSYVLALTDFHSRCFLYKNEIFERHKQNNQHTSLTAIQNVESVVRKAFLVTGHRKWLLTDVSNTDNQCVSQNAQCKTGKEAKAVPLHALKAFVGRRGIAPTHS
jgi:hypothetical protein